MGTMDIIPHSILQCGIRARLEAVYIVVQIVHDLYVT
jgi:hypothetical protein